MDLLQCFVSIIQIRKQAKSPDRQGMVTKSSMTILSPEPRGSEAMPS